MRYFPQIYMYVYKCIKKIGREKLHVKKVTVVTSKNRTGIGDVDQSEFYPYF